MLRFLLVTLAVAAMALALGTTIGVADEPWIIEAGPEAADAQKLGAAEVERAQKLAKEKKYRDAALVLEAVARKWPAAVHDCNLALAYLRDGQLTKAQLVWDVGAQRNGVRPKWCTGEVSTQLAEALRKKKLVPVTIEVVPGDAIVEVDGITMRGMHTIWLEPKTVTFNASAPGRVPSSTPLTVAAPVSRVAITLAEPPKVEPPDAAVHTPVVTPPPVTPDAGVMTTPGETPQVDAGVPARGSPIVVNGQRWSWKKTAGIATLTFSATAILLGVYTDRAKKDADSHYVTDPAFEEANQDYKDFALSTTVLSSMAAVSAIVFVYLSLTDDGDSKPPAVKVGSGPGDIGISFSGTFGDGP